jgi:hypothetical protein
MYLNAKATAAFNGEDYWSASAPETLTGSTINSSPLTTEATTTPLAKKSRL